MDAESTYKKPPESEYLEKQRKRTKKLLEVTESNTVTEFLVKLVYGEDFHLPARLLDTKIESRGEDVLNLADAIEKIELYNNFRGKKLAEEIRYLHHKGYIMDAKFGRGASPVIYINPPYWAHQASNYNGKSQGRKYSDYERNQMLDEIKKRLKRLDPDELYETDFYGVRAWWD